MDLKDVTYAAFSDEIEKIAYEGDFEKESGIQYLMGALGAARAAGRMGGKMVQQGWRAGQSAYAGGAGLGQALQTGMRNIGVRGAEGTSVFGALGRAGQRGYQVGKGRMMQAGAQAGPGAGFFGQQKAMGGTLLHGGPGGMASQARTQRRHVIGRAREAESQARFGQQMQAAQAQRAQQMADVPMSPTRGAR